MKLKRIFASISLCIVLSIHMYGQKIYTLEECRTLAIENNINIKNATIAVQSAKHEQKKAFTNYFPNISATGMGFNANKGLLQMDLGPGMNMSLIKNGILGGVTFTQPIFAGGQIINGNRLAGLGVEISEIQQEQTHDEVLLTLEKYYWQVVILKEKLNTLNSLKQQLYSIENDVQSYVNAGITTRNDLLEVQLQQNEIESNIISVKNGLSVSLMLLSQYIGEDNDIDIQYDINTAEVPDLPYDIYIEPSDVLTQTINYRLLKSNLKASQLQLKVEKGRNMPSVAVGAGYMYDNLMDKSHPFALGYVSVSIPISGWWGGSHSIKKQKLQVLKAENLISDTSELIIIGIKKSWNDLNEAHKQIVIAQQSVIQADENYRLNENYYKVGTTTISELLDAQTLLQKSNDKYIEAYGNFCIKIVEYLQVTGR